MRTVDAGKRNIARFKYGRYNVTETKQNALNPAWNEELYFVVRSACANAIASAVRRRIESDKHLPVSMPPRTVDTVRSVNVRHATGECVAVHHGQR